MHNGTAADSNRICALQSEQAASATINIQKRKSRNYSLSLPFSGYETDTDVHNVTVGLSCFQVQGISVSRSMTIKLSRDMEYQIQRLRTKFSGTRDIRFLGQGQSKFHEARNTKVFRGQRTSESPWASWWKFQQTRNIKVSRDIKVSRGKEYQFPGAWNIKVSWGKEHYKCPEARKISFQRQKYESFEGLGISKFQGARNITVSRGNEYQFQEGRISVSWGKDNQNFKGQGISVLLGKEYKGL